MLLLKYLDDNDIHLSFVITFDEYKINLLRFRTICMPSYELTLGGGFVFLELNM
jgi:hypothetical protein